MPTKPSQGIYPEDNVRAPSRQWHEDEQLRLATQALLNGRQYLIDNDWLPSSTRELMEEYEVRKRRTVLYDFLNSSIERMVERIYRTRAIAEGGDPKFEPWLKNVDLTGLNLTEFGKQVLYWQLAHGVSFVLVDFQGEPLPMFATLFDEERLRETTGVERRPYLRMYKAPEVLGFRFGNDGKLKQIRLLEYIDESVGVYGTESIEQVRVLYAPGYFNFDPDDEFRGNLESALELERFGANPVWETWRADDQTGDWYRFDGNVMMGVDEIPLVPFYGDYVAPYRGAPVFLQLADLNLQHFWKRSDIDMIEYYCSVINAWVAGLQEGEEAQFADRENTTLYTFEKSDATIQYLQVDGSSFVQLEEVLQRLEKRMQSLASEPISRMNTGVETAEAAETATGVRADMSESLTKAESLAWTHEQALQKCMELWTAFAAGSSAPVVEINKEMDAITDPSVDLIGTQWLFTQKVISGRKVLEIHQKLIPALGDVDWEEEQKQLDSETEQALLRMPDFTGTDLESLEVDEEESNEEVI